MATYHGHSYAGAHGGQDGAAKFAVGMLCKQDTGQPVYVLAHRRSVTASGTATTLPAQFEQGELLREFRVDGVHFGDLGARHGSYDADMPVRCRFRLRWFARSSRAGSWMWFT